METSFDSHEDALCALKEHEIKINTKFCVVRATQDFGNRDPTRAKTVLWQDKSSVVSGHQKFTGTPFAVLGQRVLECQHGKYRKVKDDEAHKQPTEEHENIPGNKRAHSSSKRACPAMVMIREIVRFPSHKVDRETPELTRKDKEVDIIRCLAMGKPFQPPLKVEYILCVPSEDVHRGHIVEEMDVPDEGIDQMQECGLRRKMIADRGHVVFNEISEAYEAVKKHQEDTGTKFFKHNLTKKFGNTEFDPSKKRRVLWSKMREPYIVMGYCLMYCCYGPDKHRKDKQSCRDQTGLVGDHDYIKTNGASKQICPAKITMKEIMTYPHIPIEKNGSKADLLVCTQMVRDQLETGVRRIQVTFPEEADHISHPSTQVHGPEFVAFEAMDVESPGTCYMGEEGFDPRYGLLEEMAETDYEIFHDMNDAFEAIRRHEIETTTRFSKTTVTKNFGNTEVVGSKRKKVLWNTTSQPYIVLGYCVLACHHGPDKHKATKEKAKTVSENQRNIKRRVRKSKKLDCPAKIVVKEVMVYPNISVNNYNGKKALAAQAVRHQLGSGVQGFQVFFPGENTHVNHPTGEVEGLSQWIDPDLVSKIHELVEAGVSTADEMSRHLASHVENTVGTDLPTTNRRFFPSRHTIRNHMDRAARLGVGLCKVKGRVSKHGNEKLVNRLQHVKKMIKYYTRQKKFLEKRLDAYNDNYKDAQVPVMWEEDQMYNLLKPPQGIAGGIQGTVKESPSTSSPRPKSAKKIKSMLKTTPGGKSPSSHLSASQLQESMMSPSSSQRNERLLIVQESPKRPANAFMMFCDQYKQSIQNEYMKEHKAVIPQQELAKRLALKWNSLEPEDKKTYYDMFEIERRSAEEEALTAYFTQNTLDSMYIESDNAVSSLLAGHDAL